MAVKFSQKITKCHVILDSHTFIDAVKFSKKIMRCHVILQNHTFIDISSICLYECNLSTLSITYIQIIQ